MRLRRASDHRDAMALVELAVVLPILLLLLLGSIEVGFMLRAQSRLLMLARVAARAAAAGEAEARIWERLQNAAPDMDMDRLTLTLEVQTYTGGGTWDPTWRPLYDDGEHNHAPPNSVVRATLEYRYRLLVPGLFTFLVDDPEEGTRTLRARIAMPDLKCRETRSR